ncbi:hypothetical protein DTO013E5_440 [Penicillium roqueforti]|uniref:Genomic scaffold, ProqFM164S02 n=1 Tax=Penicillium roqueforti (strain FM164) TaxID=1365484 RepID=W6QMS9_PENRF|nr:uncharacterized protein LCP9604111_698 [Penicillium roqueforti]CDM30912.1 unnamed protein product [Penicillium roqueforti FM164]KAF9253172.1 hypothetical protein LCP9604111_698 [Penicillium roqueforti]KAI1838688.1 hypothetical protein CBS147337_413 [Penicillium roqueforti]KAI2680416.1 hypothetical protein CBS147355_3396 [Penicillium roqueforti]KAI2691195.1 hypothetical protein LCP963914a_1396 [Penicillium roqueforti]
MRSSIIFLSALATAVMADNSTDTYTFPAGFNIGLVDSGTLSSWCSAQRNTCPDLCSSGTKLNSCDPTTLKFSCVCSDGSTPNVTSYIQTVPFYVCQATYGQCINSHPNDAEGQRACKQASADCGSKNASAVTTTSSAAATSASATSTLALATTTDSSTTATSSVAAASTTTNAAVALGDLTQYSTGLMAGLMFVAARMIL